MKYAIDEFYVFLSQLPSPANQDDKRLWYLASMVSEFAYHHIPEFELEEDNAKRAKVIPCEAFQDLVARGQGVDIPAILRGQDIEDSFVIADRGIVAIGVRVSDRLFVGLRGTVFLYDWRINLRARFTKLAAPFTNHSSYWPSRDFGRYHAGFAEEVGRIGALLAGQLQIRTSRPKELIICGHSLGGAVAAVCEPLFWGWADRCRTITFGAPRFCDASALYARPALPVTIKRMGDMVPTVPPRSKGFADCPKEYDTFGRPAHSELRDHYSTYLKWRWALFMGTRARPHSMEGYRTDIGRLVQAQFGDRPLTAASRIK